MSFPCVSVTKYLPANEGDMNLIPGLGKSPGGENGNLLQYSCLENSWTEALVLHAKRHSEVSKDIMFSI